jgi:carbamoyltransferase
VIPAVTPLMQQLDRALFFGETEGCPWSLEELKQLSAQGAKFKETSLHFQDSPFHAPLQTRLSEQVILLLDPLGQSTLVDLTHKLPPQSYSYAEVQLLLALLQAPADSLEQLRIARQLTTQEFREQARSMQAQLHRYQLLPQPTPVQSSDDAFARATQTLEPFAEESFSLRQCLGQLRDRLKQLDYTADTICRLLGITAQQQIEPTRLHYYDRYRLPHNQLGDLIRLFLLRSVVPEVCLTQIFGEDLFATLRDLGVLIPRGNAWASRIDLFDVEGLYIATDHRYMILPEDKIDENPVMYVGMDSMGLVHTAPRYSVDRVLDLCCGGGIQGLIASRYAKSVASVDINPRAIRYARFNAQLNGIDNIQFHLGSLYQAVQGKFDTILANPPFVPSPTQEFRFRDGGNTGEDILSEIIRGSADHLTPKGHLFIVTDLVDVGSYADKLRRWWQGGVSDQLVLCTADRDDILFSVPHCHAAFNQTYKEYSAQLDQWICNFHRSGLTAVNFGYILIRRSLSMSSGSYYTRTIHNPDRPIHQQVAHYFQGRDRLRERNLGQYALQLSEGLNFRIETNSKTGTSKIELFSTENPYFTTYPINQMLYLLLQDIQRFRPNWSAYITPMNQACIQDLIYKGIIALIPQSTLSDPPAGINPLSIFEDPAKPVLPQPAEDVDGGSSASLEAWAIRELQTKTTPTCLSSYLG